MADNARGGMTSGWQIPILGSKMAKKWPKMAIFWPKMLQMT